MRAEEYDKIKKKIYDEYPTGIDHMALGDTDTLFEELSGQTTIPPHFDSECAIHQLNMLATNKHLRKYKVKIETLYKLAIKIKNKKNNKKLNIKIDTLAKLINECQENIKMSKYGIKQTLTENPHMLKNNICN